MSKPLKGIDRWGFPLRASPAVEADAVAAQVSGVVPDESLPPLKRKRGPRSARRERLHARLKEMCDARQPGETFSYAEIARRCNVSAEYIKQVETSALKKLRDKLPPDIRDFLNPTH